MSQDTEIQLTIKTLFIKLTKRQFPFINFKKFEKPKLKLFEDPNKKLSKPKPWKFNYQRESFEKSWVADFTPQAYNVLI